MKKIISIALIMVICCLCFCSCTTKKDVVGLWRKTERGESGTVYYYRIFDNGTYDSTYDDKEPSDIGTKWTLKGDTITLEWYSKNLPDDVYTVSDGKFLSGSGKVIAEKISDDPTKIE